MSLFRYQVVKVNDDFRFVDVIGTRSMTPRESRLQALQLMLQIESESASRNLDFKISVMSGSSIHVTALTDRAKTFLDEVVCRALEGMDVIR